MTRSEKNPSPDFFEEHHLDPVAVATGKKLAPVKPVAKKKAGFYLSESLLERFNKRFHQMKIDGYSIENKSALVEIALGFALDDLDSGQQSKLAAVIK